MHTPCLALLVFLLHISLSNCFKEYSVLKSLRVSHKFQKVSVATRNPLFLSTDNNVRRESYFKHQALPGQWNSLNQSYQFVGSHIGSNITGNSNKNGELLYERKLINSLINAANEFTSANKTHPPLIQGQQNTPTGWWFVKSSNKTSNSTSENKVYTLKDLIKSRKNAPRFITGMMLIYFAIQHWMNSRESLGTHLEVAFSQFLNILTTDPNRFQYIEVLPNTIKYILDGKIMFTNRAAMLENVLMEKLVSSGVLFRVNPTATPSPSSRRPPLFYLITVYLFLSLLKFVYSLVFKMFRKDFETKKGSGSEKKEEEDSSSTSGIRKQLENFLNQEEGEEGIVGNIASELQLSLQYGNLSFTDFAGQESAKSEVKELCDMLKESERYKALGARLPSGVLLVGPPGSGKTLLARITAAEARVPFYACAASDFVEIFVGRGPQRVRRLFATASHNAPCIVFIDEIDSIGRTRRQDGLDSERDATLNQLLTCMDGLDTSNNGVIVMAATNRVETLDSALLRPGRFDRIVNCPLPDR
jgi:ATP-dependent Zn protease